jgi:hypothetical protein
MKRSPEGVHEDERGREKRNEERKKRRGRTAM